MAAREAVEARRGRRGVLVAGLSVLAQFGVWLLITTVLQVVLGAIVKGGYLWLSGAEHGRLDLTLDSSALGNVFISALFMLVARVLADAYVIAEENKQII